MAIERLIPRAKDEPIPLPLPEKLTLDSLKPMVESIMRELENGNITPHETKSLLDVMRGYRDYVAAEELYDKYKMLKEQFDKQRNGNPFAKYSIEEGKSHDQK